LYSSIVIINGPDFFQYILWCN